MGGIIFFIREERNRGMIIVLDYVRFLRMN